MSRTDDPAPTGRIAISVERLERVARLYHQNADAAAALGITSRSFARLCRRHGIETPWARNRNAKG